MRILHGHGEAMTCHHCDKPALYVVAGIGYCEALKEEASKATVALGSKVTGIGMKVYPKRPK